MAAFRFRRLEPGKSDSATAPEYGDLSAVVGVAGRVYEVGAEERVEDYEEIVRLLKLGRLMPSDLVFSQGIWRTFSEAPEFYEACEGLFDSRGYEMKLDSVLYGLLVAAAIFILKGVIPFWLATMHLR